MGKERYMKKKLICIFVFTLFIATMIIPVSGVLYKPGRPVMRQIEGPNNPTMGKVRTWYFEAWDPDGDLMTIYVFWGDNWTDARVALSNVSKSITHIFLTKGNFTIKAYAIDQNAERSEDVTLSLNVLPRNRIRSNYMLDNTLFLRFIERFLDIFPNLRYILGFQ